MYVLGAGGRIRPRNFEQITIEVGARTQDPR
jgi:hypothetical protein